MTQAPVEVPIPDGTQASVANDRGRDEADESVAKDAGTDGREYQCQLAESSRKIPSWRPIVSAAPRDETAGPER